MSQDFYLTISKPFRATELKVVGSRFIADLYPVSTKEEIESYLDRIRKEFYDASHHCYAFRLGANAEQVRAADDGEPSGTAGKPILMVIEGAKLTNVLCVVTRYFGGTKLGTGGLARAYADAAKLAVEDAQIKTVYHMKELRLTYSFDDMSGVERMIAKYGAEKLESVYSDTVEMRISIRQSLVEEFKKELVESLLGRVTIDPS
ncbi:MAG TPA: YigZ family protein [Candidatus Kapabacteria bacterium]